jgi:hypothetical protein
VHDNPARTGDGQREVQAPHDREEAVQDRIFERAHERRALDGRRFDVARGGHHEDDLDAPGQRRA